MKMCGVVNYVVFCSYFIPLFNVSLVHWFVVFCSVMLQHTPRYLFISLLSFHSVFFVCCNPGKLTKLALQRNVHVPLYKSLQDQTDCINSSGFRWSNDFENVCSFDCTLLIVQHSTAGMLTIVLLWFCCFQICSPSSGWRPCHFLSFHPVTPT